METGTPVTIFPLLKRTQQKKNSVLNKNNESEHKNQNNKCKGSKKQTARTMTAETERTRTVDVKRTNKNSHKNRGRTVRTIKRTNKNSQNNKEDEQEQSEQ